ncbi:hypothetical protein [Fusobacterium sp. SYSU M8D902]|uniref:hypothetical protein n=1 Tax=Fusobacterium sp. SYSU M8D902 TaxID=3159562 RepID=UPI0032E38F47
MELLTEILKSLESDLSMTIVYLKPVAMQLLAWFFGFELLSGMLHSEAGSNPLIIFKSKISTWAYLYAIIYFYQDLLDLIKSMFTYFCKVAIGNGIVPDLVEMPTKVLALATTSIFQMASYAKLGQPSTWLVLVGVVFGLFVFAQITFTVGMVVIEYMVLTSLVIVLIPFMMFKKMAFVGDKVLGMVINLNMKILTIRFLMFYFTKFLSKGIPVVDGMEGTQILENIFYWLVAMACLGIMSMQGHSIAQALISGATSFGDSAEAIGKLRQSTGSLVKGVMGGFSGIGTAHGVYQGIKQGAKASTENNSGGIMGAVGGIKAGMQEGRDLKSNHVGAYGVGGAIGGGLRGFKNTFGKKPNNTEPKEESKPETENKGE